MRNLALASVIVAMSPSLAWSQVPAGGEFQVNTYTTGGQIRQAIASDVAGNLVVVWENSSGDRDSVDIFAQRFDATGARRGGEFRVNTHTTYVQWMPAVASDAAGDFLVVWASGQWDERGGGVFAQRFDAAGARRGGELEVAAGLAAFPAAASDSAGNFVVAWEDYPWGDLSARRFDAAGAPRGGEFRVNTYTTGSQRTVSVASDPAGNLVFAWHSDGQDGDGAGVFAQRFDAAGLPQGGEFQVNTYTTAAQWDASVASDSEGGFVVVWERQLGAGIFGQRFDAAGERRGGEFQASAPWASWPTLASVASDSAGNFVVAWVDLFYDGSSEGVFAQRFDAGGAHRGAEFRVNTYTTQWQSFPCVASDASGNFTVAWESVDQDGSSSGIFAQRFGGLQPTAVSVDPTALVAADGNDIFEPGESVRVAPSWRNINGQTLTFDGGLLSFSGPSGPGVSYSVQQALARYGTVANGDTVTCSDCFQVGVELAGPRPATHWDATLTERISPDALGQTKPWALHVGESFSDIPRASPFYPFVETILHRGVTGGCSATTYCPTSPVTREQVAVFTLVGKEGALYSPQACTSPPFTDVPTSSPFCRYVAELANRGVVSGCGNGNYCPTDPVTREQMPVFVLRVLDPALVPPPCGTPVFNDVPATSPYCTWIEELARRGVVSGCGNGNYCPSDPVTREQMAVFVSVAFGLGLYGP